MMKNKENLSSRRHFISIGASSAAMLLGGAALAQTAAQTTAHTAKTSQASAEMLGNGDTFTFDSVESMKAAKDLKAGDIAYTLGFHQAGDDGDNAYLIVPSSNNSENGIQLDLSNGLAAKGLFPGGEYRVEQFGAIGIANSDSSSLKPDNTQAMQLAHNTGKVITYGAKHYYFSTVSIPTGGINGKGENTVLVSTDATAKDVITYQGVNEEGEHSANFSHFMLTRNTATQKVQGAGIRFIASSKNQSYSALVSKVKIENIPTGIHASSQVFYSIQDSLLSGYSKYGLYIEATNSETSLQNSLVQNNTLHSEFSDAIAVSYHAGNVNIINNNILGGSVGIDLTGNNSQTMVQITGNTLEGQNQNGIRFGSQASGLKTESDFSQVLVSQNRINATRTSGAAIYAAPTHFPLSDLSINNNLIRFLGDEDSVAAINLNNCSRFMVNNNTINCENGRGHRGIFVGEDCSSGVLSANHVILPLNGHTLNQSKTTTVV